MESVNVKFTNQSIVHSDGRIVMHSWEHPIMQQKAEWICQGGGDILEIGFGMGISATYIQQHSINSHTICENNPQILSKLYEWAQDKPNVKVIEGDWYQNIDKMGTYDGMMIDTYADDNFNKFGSFIPQLSNDVSYVTWWNNYHSNCESFGYDVHFESIEVDPPPNDYYNEKMYLSPQLKYKK